ncbi:hypothetical protein ACE3NQ_08600 [Paenibacillus terreus]|uniref:Uncharacterized protein n=1 Tax=Paenibacillus terreus TaxID=1387834 RepID=A0ABV5B657_9BACL
MAAFDFDKRLVIWAMDQVHTLKSIIDVLRMDYNIPIDYLSERDDLTDYEKTLQIQWHPAASEGFSIECLKIGDVEYNYISVIGKYEDLLGEKRAVIDGRVLPREYRVFNKTVDVVFFENYGRVYCILDVSVSQEKRVRSVLFGQGYRKLKKEEWGKVQYDKLMQYTLDSDFFYWLFNKRGQKINIQPAKDREDYFINLIDIHAVSQLSERDVHDNKSEGAGVLGSIPTLSGLGINQNVYEGGLHIIMPDMQLLTKVTKSCTCVLDSTRSVISKEGGSSLIVDDFPKTSILIYTILFPGLLSLYHAEKINGEWSAEKGEQQRKAWALDVIKQLASDNSITMEDIEEVLY